MAICIAASICASAAVYFLLRSRMSVLEDTVATLCRAVQETSVSQQRVACMSIPESARTGAAIVNSIITKPQLIAVSDDDDSSYIATSDEEEEEHDPGSLKTVTLTGGGPNILMGADLSSIITSISGAEHSTKHLAVEHISKAEENTQSSSDSEESDNESDNENENESDNESDNENESDKSAAGSDSLEGYDFTKYKVPELRAFVVQYQLAPNPTKLRKGDLLDLLIEAQSS